MFPNSNKRGNMHSFFRITIFTFLLGLCSIPVIAQDGTKPVSADKIQPAVKPTPDNGKKSEIAFPDVAGWTKGEKTKYPTNDLGYSVGYTGKGAAVTVYVYNGGNKSIPNDLTGIVKAELERAKSDIFAAERAGYYTDVEEVKSDTAIVGGQKGKVKALRALFTLTARGMEMNSEIYIFPYENNFIKIRATHPKSSIIAIPEEDLIKLLFEIDSMFAN